MQLTDEVGHRALAYVAAVSRHGYSPTVEEFNAYVSLPIRRPGESDLGRALMANLLPALRAFTAAPAESILAWLERLGWLHKDGDHVFITRLGRAVLADLEETGREEELPTELVLDPTDVLSYAKLVGSIAEAGECALVDGFFGIDNFLDVVQRTRVTRILVRPDYRKEGRLEALQQAVKDYRFDRSFEIRSSDGFHDRRVAATGNIHEPAATAIRAAFEEAWKRAALVARPTSERDGEPVQLEPETTAAVTEAAQSAVEESERRAP